MRFDQFTIALLVLRPDTPQLSDADAAALQDAHLAHLAGLHETGALLAAGRFSVVILPWLVPGGAMSFSPARFPRSMAETESAG